MTAIRNGFLEATVLYAFLREIFVAVPRDFGLLNGNRDPGDNEETVRDPLSGREKARGLRYGMRRRMQFAHTYGVGESRVDSCILRSKG